MRLLITGFQRVPDQNKILFEVNRFYVLRAEFNKHGSLIELAVEPKYYFEADHPDWKEQDDFTDLSQSEYLALLARLDRTKDRGKLIRLANTISSVTNMTAWYTERYENASLTWGQVVDLRKGDDHPNEVRWFRLKYGANAESLSSGTEFK
ncbi:MAG TPA: hypothetical protein VK468_04255 [Pyrinomonadaceae bacterium]|nr:hypothetical protein [Pyrinomonadaceae bacterium]